ncbi:arginyltransferase [Planctomycetes bacterium K23_9]|uniref:Arginyl-tRNA-protein transferase n=1 Tax=Stieleria marina TaxID=1930275 RepID=A0A517NRD1_9BACT|nr:arginyl-tRNA-protein transferase [Planctomycetes bacterium K23_9]
MNYLDADQPLRQTSGKCKLVVVQDQLQECPYLADTTARMPLRLPVGDVTPQITDELLAMGYRRSGDFVYRTQCPTCSECKPTRVPVATFKLTSSMRRVLKRGDRELTHKWGPPQIDQERVAMFNQHRLHRNLGSGEPVDEYSYGAFLNDTCCDTLELSVYRDQKLVSVSVIDVGENSISAVYTHFDPKESRYSLGTYGILKQAQWAAQTNRQFVYLGMYVADNSHLNYKARFGPQQRLCDGQWTDFEV